MVFRSQHHVGIGMIFRLEQRVGGQGADRVDVGRARSAQCGLDDVDFLAAEMSGLAGMGIEAADQDAWPRDTEAATQVGVKNFQRHTQRIAGDGRSEEHTSELQSLMRISYAVFCLKKKKTMQKIIF